MAYLGNVPFQPLFINSGPCGPFVQYWGPIAKQEDASKRDAQTQNLATSKNQTGAAVEDTIAKTKNVNEAKSNLFAVEKPEHGLNDDNGAAVAPLRYSILVVLPSQYLKLAPPNISVKTNLVTPTEQKSNETDVIECTVSSATRLDVILGYSFWRFIVDVTPHLQWDINVQYTVNEMAAYDFRVPAADRHWKVGFYSCNGYSSDVSAMRIKRYGLQSPLWEDVKREAKSDSGLHLLVGGGDQLYFDSLWDRVPGLRAWAQQRDLVKRKDADFTEFVEPVIAHYLDIYLAGFGALSSVFGIVPSVMSWDDHDIFDGYGSYPAYLQESNVFKGIYRCARRLYMLFQMHTCDELAEKAGTPDAEKFLGYNTTTPKPLGLHRVLECGKYMSLVLPDTRSERSLLCIVKPESWDLMFNALETQSKKTMRHIYFLAPVPVVYPHSGSTSMFSALSASAQVLDSSINRLQGGLRRVKSSLIRTFSKKKLNASTPNLSKDTLTRNTENPKKSTSAFSRLYTALYKKAVNVFNEPELNDDINDHWTVLDHAEERRTVLKRFAEISLKLQARVTILSGDVHLAAVGMTYTTNSEAKHGQFNGRHLETRDMQNLKQTKKQPKTYEFPAYDVSPIDAKYDNQMFVQIVSSAICNLPPPRIIVASMCRKLHRERIFENMLTQMISLFARDDKGQADAGFAGDGKRGFFARKRNWALCETTSTHVHLTVCLESSKGGSTGATRRYTIRVPQLEIAD